MKFNVLNRITMGTGETHQCFFPLTSLQIGDLQSYRSSLSLFLACESNKLFILVDNRPWLIDLDSRVAHLWHLMITKSRLSPFANTRSRRDKKDGEKKLDSKDTLNTTSPDISKPNKSKRWTTLVNVAALSQKKVLLDVQNLKKSMLLIIELRRTLYGFIVFEVAWDDVRGINYLNELQTDTFFALETKFMKRWEFESIEEASCGMSSWFSGTKNEHVIFQECLDLIEGEVFYDANEDFPISDSTGDGETACSGDEGMADKHDSSVPCNFSEYPAGMEYKSLLHNPPPSNGVYERILRKSLSFRGENGVSSEDTVDEIFGTPRYSENVASSCTTEAQNTVEPAHYKDVLILFRFNDCDLPFKLRDIIMYNLRLLRLLEAGLPSWVIFLQSYPLFCHLYRPWMCPLVRTLYVLISIVTVMIGFYDLYKNVPVLKATASRLCGPLFDWIETWEMISRIKYLGTMLFLHNFEVAVKWFLICTRAIRSFILVLTQPMAGPVLEILDIFFPFWNTFLQTGEGIYSVIWLAIDSSYSLIVNLLEVVFMPMWSILSIIWSTASSVIWPIFVALYEILYAPLRVVLAFAKFSASAFSSTFEVLREIWLSVSSMIQLASASESTISTYEVSMWRSLWNDLFSQIFRATKSIIHGFVAFFAACNRHRLSIYNHTQQYLRRVSYPSATTLSEDSGNCSRRSRVESVTVQLEYNRKAHDD
ncbi:hypothetical protein MKW98_026249 [Papaver atlanticum]|uniref:Uncharacterized protein n=1 Tax=Papaver atlanticum TaxID=357466 RepID=A0AAD4SRN1_9MAGN|nr:hypothetical protein MKW98_026249 [Papaver atlanticum]